MTRFQIRFSDLPSTSRLFRDFIYAPDSLTRWFGYDYRDPDSYRQTAERLFDNGFSRTELSRVLLSQNKRFGATSETLENIELLAQDAALCTITGHQVVLLGGPMMVFYKAMSVIKLARKLSDILARPVVPVFWLATDDHDFAEVDHVYLPSGEGKPAKITYVPMQQIAGKPISRVLLDHTIDDFLDEASSALSDTDFKDELLDLLRSCYSEGLTIFEAFARLLLHYFGKYGLVIAEPADPALRSLARDVFGQAIADFETVRDSISDTNASLLGAGYHLQVTRPEEYVNLFIDTDKRSRIGYRDGRFSVDGADWKYSREELIKLIDTSPARFSPDVLLRLIVQSKLFPAVAMVGGPAEIAYFAQAKKLFSLFGVVPPIPHSRLSATIFERHVADFVEKQDIDIPRLQTYGSREEYLTSVLREKLPGDVKDALEKSHMRIMAEFESIKEIVGTDSGLARTSERARRKVDYELSSLKEKIFKAHRKAHNDFSLKFRRVAELLFPEQSLQERHCSFMYFAGKYGPDVVDRIMKALDIDTYEHQVIRL